MDVKEEAAKSAVGKLVASALVLIGLLLLAAWRVFLSGAWARVEAATPKQGLEVLLGLAGIAICLLVGALIDNWRKKRRVPAPEPKMLKRMGVLWDKDQNPHCPVDKTLLIYASHREASPGRAAHDWLYCLSCKQSLPLYDSQFGHTTLFEAQNRIRDFLRRGLISD